MSLTRRSLTLALAATPLAGPAFAQGLSAGDQALVDRAIAYLEGLREAKGRFVQTDSRGRKTQGDIYLKRPGRARFAYDPPSGLTVVSDGAAVLVRDDRLGTFDRYPLGTTPLSLFLAKTIRLDRGVSITRVARQADGFTITARDTDKKAAGQISLTFTDTPLKLAGWTVIDAQNRATHVRLLNLERASGLDGDLFDLKNPKRQATRRHGV